MNITKQAKNSFISYILSTKAHKTYTGDTYSTYIVLNGLQAKYFNNINKSLRYYQNECNNAAAVFQCRAFFAKYGDDVLHVKRIV